MKENEIKGNPKGVLQTENVCESHDKFRIRRIEMLHDDGRKVFEHVSIEVDDLEAFRAEIKARGYASVKFIYETLT